MIEVGDFIRTDDGIIGKIKRIELDNTDKTLKWYVFDRKRLDMNMTVEVYINKPYIVKYSKNIIDLLEEGDIVNGFSISKFDNEDGNEFLAIPIYNDAQLDCIEEVRPIATIKIKTILTKEQYMQNCYTVERKEE